MQIIHDNHVYNFFAKCKQYISWRCYKKDCSGRIHSNFMITEIININNHFHEPNKIKLLKMEFKNKMKNIALTTHNNFDTALTTVSAAFHRDELENINGINNIRDYFIKIQKKKQNFNNIKTSVELLDIFKYTYTNELFLQYSSNNEN